MKVSAKQMEPASTNGIVLFDGVCNFCHASVNFIIDRDPKDHFRFASLQSETGIALAAQHGIDSTQLASIILIEGDQAYTQSTAAFMIAKRLRGLWPMLGILLIVPRPIRDFIYQWVARNRYRLFGRADSCRVPTPALTHRFLDS